MRSLLDVNVLVALLDRQHAAHFAANQWLANQGSAGWASCPITENGCLRVLTNPRYPAPLPARDVLERLRVVKADGNSEFWSDDVSITSPQMFNFALLQGHQQVTDLYLLALAVARGGRLVTFDRGISLPIVTGATAQHLVQLPY